MLVFTTSASTLYWTRKDKGYIWFYYTTDSLSNDMLQWEYNILGNSGGSEVCGISPAMSVRVVAGLCDYRHRVKWYNRLLHIVNWFNRFRDVANHRLFNVMSWNYWRFHIRDFGDLMVWDVIMVPMAGITTEIPTVASALNSRHRKQNTEGDSECSKTKSRHEWNHLEFSQILLLETVNHLSDSSASYTLRSANDCSRVYQLLSFYGTISWLLLSLGQGFNFFCAVLAQWQDSARYSRAEASFSPDLLARHCPRPCAGQCLNHYELWKHYYF